MKVVLLQKKYSSQHKTAEKNYGCSYMVYSAPDLSVYYLAAVAQHHGHEVIIYGYDSLNDLSLHLPRADKYIIHSVYLSKDEDLSIAKLLSEQEVYFYGPAPTLHPGDFLDSSKHYVLRGEIEHILPKALNVPQKCLGVSYRSGGRIKHNTTAGIIENLDQVPFPNLSQKPIFQNPKFGYRKTAMILASRGCIGQCTFCVPNSISWARELEWKKYHTNKPPVKFRTVDNIVSEISQYVEVGIKYFSFIDDQFIISKKHTAEFSAKIKPFNIHYGILARCDKLTDELTAQDLADSGCRYVDLGVESFNQRVLDDIKKGISEKDVFNSINNLKKVGIEPKLNIMFGTSELENPKIIKESIKTTLKLPVKYCMYSIATPYEGTLFYDKAQKRGWIDKTAAIDPAHRAQINYPHLSSDNLEKLTRRAYRRFYFRPFIALYHLRQVFFSPRNITQFFRSVINFFKS